MDVAYARKIKIILSVWYILKKNLCTSSELVIGMHIYVLS